MESFELLRGKQLCWKQPHGLEKEFELYAGEDLIATLAFRSTFGTLAYISSSLQDFTFKRVGFLNSRITIRKQDQEEDFATYYPRFWGDGMLLLSDGHTFTWAPQNFWRTRWMFYSNGDIPAILFEERDENLSLKEIFKTQAHVEILDPSVTVEELSLLIPLGFYLIIMHKNDAAAAAAAGAGH